MQVNYLEIEQVTLTRKYLSIHLHEKKWRELLLIRNLILFDRYQNIRCLIAKKLKVLFKVKVKMIVLLNDYHSR